MFNTFNFMAINRCCILGGPYVTRFGIMSRKSPKVELRYGPRKSE